MPVILEQLRSQLINNYQSWTNYHVALIDDTRSSYSFTSTNISGSTFTIPGHNFINGTRVVLGVSGGSLPTPLAVGSFGTMTPAGIIPITGTAYFVVSQSGNTFQLSATSGGIAVGLTGTLSGTGTIQDVPLDATVSTMNEWTRKELSNYQGAATRQSYVASSTATVDSVNGRVFLAEHTAEFNNASGSASLIFDKALLIRNGTNSPRNLSGSPDSFFWFGAAQTIAPGEIRGIRIPNILRNA